MIKQGLFKYDNLTNCKLTNQYLNIGDYIQSLAARQFLTDKNPILVNRENLKNYNSENISLIMNGWFLYKPENWPPSDKIIPLFISFHLNSSVYNILDNNEVVMYFKKHEPIGCRDYDTANILMKYGIKSYFSGCLTTTLGLTYNSNTRNNKVYIIDPYFDSNFNLKNLLKAFVNIMLYYKSLVKITKMKYEILNIKNLILTAFFFSDYKKVMTKSELQNAEYRGHYLKVDKFINEESKFKYAENLLNEYSRAKIVITSRIHVALPCLGLNTNFFYIQNIEDEEISTCRLNGLLDFLNVIKYNKGKFTYNDCEIKKLTQLNIPNKEVFEPYKSNLIKTCKDFINGFK